MTRAKVVNPGTVRCVEPRPPAMPAGETATCVEPSPTSKSPWGAWASWNDWCDRHGPHPRRGAKWSPEEDRRLMALVADGFARYPDRGLDGRHRGDTPIWFAARRLGRNTGGVYVRYLNLIACRKRAELATLR